MRVAKGVPEDVDESVGGGATAAEPGDNQKSLSIVEK